MNEPQTVRGLAMIFDKLCRIAERGLVDLDIEDKGYKYHTLRSILSQAALFSFPQRFHEVAPIGGEVRRELYRDGREFWRENFFLPISPMVIEDTASAIVVMDAETGAKGFAPRRFFLEAASLANPNRFDEFGHTDPLRVVADVVTLTWGEVWELDLLTSEEARKRGLPSPESVSGEMTTVQRSNTFGAGFVSFRPEKSVLLDTPEGWRDATITSLRNLWVAIEEVMYFNVPSRFVLETSPVLKRPPTFAKGQIPRSNVRSIFTTIERQEIRNLGFREVSEDGNDRTPTWVRRHFRTLRSERYANSGKRFQRIVIPAHWRGPTELITPTGKKRYKIRVDL